MVAAGETTAKETTQTTTFIGIFGKTRLELERKETPGSLGPEIAVGPTQP